MANGKLGILVGGGPAPGINGVIAAATIEALGAGVEVVGILDGYTWLTRGDTGHTRALTLEAVDGIQTMGGSILRTARVNPGADPALVANAIGALGRLGVDKLICIGGDDTTFGATKIAHAAAGSIRVASVPKTIDNDLPLPEGTPTFGFESARAAGARVVEALIADARTTGRWYLAITMGRTSGSLALGMATSAYAPIALIPEEFERPTVAAIADAVCGAIVKRKALGRSDGVAVIAEGIVEKFDVDELAKLESVPRDAYGHVRLADIPIDSLVTGALRTRLRELALDVTIVSKEIGYELRCTPPNPFDIEYTRELGSAASRYLLEGGSGALVSLGGGGTQTRSLDELLDPATGRIRLRHVDTNGQAYKTARRFMTRLEPGDFEEPSLGRLSAGFGLDPATFRARFEPLLHRPRDGASSPRSAERFS